MDTKTFLNKVLDNTDNYVLYLSRDTTKWNENHSTLDEVCEAISRYDKTSTTVYFAIGKFNNNVEVNPKTQRKHAKRRKEYATRFKTLCCDIDVGPNHVYKTQQEAAKALLAACNTMGLAHPSLVSSGTGLHGYWSLLESVNADIWEKCSITLRTALHANNVDIDASKIHDKSMVLRPVGTHHKKDPQNWKEVKLLYDQPSHDIRDLLNPILKYKDIVAAQAKGKAKLNNEMLAAVLDSAANLVLDDLRKCKQVDVLVSSAGKLDISGKLIEEPLWRASLGIAKYCLNQEDAVIRLAGGHPDFDLDANLKKLEGWRGTGPTTCATFKSLCPEGCLGCKYEGKLTSPAQLSGGITEVPVVHPVTGVQVSIKLPPRYSFKNKCVVYTPAGSDEDVFVSPYMMYVVARFSDVEEKRAIAKIAVEFPVEGTKIIDIEIPTIATGGTELSKALALKQVYTYGDNKYLRQYLMTYLKELQSASAMDYYYKHYGWQNDGTFLGCDGLVGKPPSGHIHYDGPIEEQRVHMRSKGDLQAWVRGTKLFDHPELKHHGLVFLMMGGSVLLKGSGLASLFINSYSRDSGSGKTLTAKYGLSIWGNPTRMMFTVNDTDNAMYKKFGVFNSIGAYIDEITTMDIERLRDFVLTLPEGREKERVKQNTEGFRDKAHWNMPIFGSSNRDIYDALGTRYSSEAEKLRVLQFVFDRVSVFEENGLNLGYKVSHFLDENYGLVGPLIVEEIMRRGGYAKVYGDAFEAFSDKYRFKFLGQERFWKSAFVIADAFNDIATSLGLIAFNGRRKIFEGLEALESMRTTVKEEQMRGLDVIMQYLNEIADRIVHWREAHLKVGLRQYALDPTPKVAFARSEIAYDDNGTFLGGQLFINQAAFKTWCRRNGAEYRHVLIDLIHEGVKVRDNARKVLFKGVPGGAALGQTYCLAIDMSSHARLIAAAEAASVYTPMECAPRLEVVK